MGPLNVNMPMLYGEGKQALHRLQLEIIHSSDDQSIFVWESSVRIGSILADDPSGFEDCSRMELIDHDEFTKRFLTTLMYSQLRIVVSKAGCPSVAIVTPILSSGPTYHAGTLAMEWRAMEN